MSTGKFQIPKEDVTLASLTAATFFTYMMIGLPLYREFGFISLRIATLLLPLLSFLLDIRVPKRSHWEEKSCRFPALSA